ncbi:GRB2-associated-binding protein 3 isoform X2 [Denticeps clupeoides]|uniref:GRB2-associated-binding protein 3 isoform X2 n=1 Tax=Denticeps clupeoides TaxID=299321 RepID=UPI0010A3B7B7|nr:GRB2-associated-binding protein 3 isoform X2 [Denticeps clupeoides]
MSDGDVVLMGWLIKSPPEKKLKRYSWRKRWFVLRRGRMSGNPDVLEYYRSRSSKKPIRIIDLQECEVQMPAELLLIKRQLQNQHLFVVKTTTRKFYLLAKTQEEMNSWVQCISQICTFGPLDDSIDSADRDSSAQGPASQQPSPALSHVASHSESETSPTLDYLFLSQCETGTISIARCDSFTNTESSLDQSSSDNATEDVFSSPPHTDPSPCPFLMSRASDPPFSAPCGPTSLSSSSSSSPRSLHHPRDVFCFDRPFCENPDLHTPPPLPPKPTHFAEQHLSDGCRHLGQPVIPRRISLSGLDHVRRGEFDMGPTRNWDKRLSLNLPALTVSASPLCQSEDDSYVPMASPATAGDVPSDCYVPMSPSTVTATFLRTNGKTEPPPPPAPDLEPPPIHRNLKPKTRARPPPLDLRALSTIREYSTHLPLSRRLTEPSTSLQFVPPDRRWGSGLNSTDQEASSTPIVM